MTRRREVTSTVEPASAPRRLLLVNGLPASGKTTLARQLSAELGAPLLSKDVVKETLFDCLGAKDSAQSRTLGAASMEVLWSLATFCPTTAIVESWMPPSTRPFVVDGVARAGFDDVVEVWCACSLDEVIRRSHARRVDRHPGHALVENDDQLREWATEARPLGIGVVLTVDTSRPVDVGALLERIH